MPIVIVSIVFGSFLLFMKMILDYKRQNQIPQTVQDNSSMRLSELKEMMETTVQDAIEPLVARIDELESSVLLGNTERILIGESAESSKKASNPQVRDR